MLQWVQTRSMPWPMLSSKGSRKVEQFRSSCQEEMKAEEIMKLSKKSKVEPVSKWHCPHQAGSFKVHQAKAEVQEDQARKGIAREAHQELQDGTPWMKEEKRKRKKNSQGKDPRTFEAPVKR